MSLLPECENPLSCSCHASHYFYRRFDTTGPLTQLQMTDRSCWRNLSGWNVANVEFMDSMFANTFFFNIDISRWSVSKVKSMTSMFKHALSFDQNLCAWGQLLEKGVNVTDIFAVSGCANMTDPSFEAASRGPWCQICDRSG